MDSTRFRGRMASLTGAGSGIGRATVLRLASDDASCINGVSLDTDGGLFIA